MELMIFLRLIVYLARQGFSHMYYQLRVAEKSSM